MTAFIHIHQITRRYRQLRGKPCAFGIDRVFNHLHQNFLALVQQCGDIWSASVLVSISLPSGKTEVIDMQKSGALNPYINKSRLHTWQYTNHLTLIDIAHQAATLVALYGNFLRHAIFYQGYASFHRRNIDKNFSAHTVFRKIKRFKLYYLAATRTQKSAKRVHRTG